MKTYSNISLIFWISYLILFPFQIFPPGNIQIADFSILLGIVTSNPFKWKIDNYISTLIYFVLYTFLVSIIFFLYYDDIDFLKNPLNLLYCLFALIFVAQLQKNPNFIKVTLYTILISFLIQLRAFQILGFNELQSRFTLFFNNPNQLGLWATTFLLYLCFIFLFNLNSSLQKLIITISILFSIFYISLSISQAAIVSAFLILFLFCLYIYNFKNVIFSLILVLILLVSFSENFKFDNIQVLANVQTRINKETSEDDGDNGLEGRNYTRLYNYPQYLLFGAGEAKVDRFGSDGLEIHSTFANILFSYGIVGLILFVIPIINFILNKSLISSSLYLSFLIFTLVHNTIRWPLFWIIPYLIYNLSPNIPFLKMDKRIINNS